MNGGKVKFSEGFVERARKVLDGFSDVKFAALFGSLVIRGETYHDVDVALKVDCEDKYEVICRVVEGLARALKLQEECIDVVDLDRAGLELKKDVLTRGVTLVDRGGYSRALIDEVNARYLECGEIQEASVKEWINSRNPSINLNIVKGRLDFTKGELQFLHEQVLSHSVEEVEASPVLRRLLERSFQLIIEAMLDISRHIVSVMGWGPALSYSDLAEICFRHAVVEGEVKESLLNAVRLRNLIIHRYIEVDYERLYEEAGKLESVVRCFEGQILNFIRSSRSRSGSTDFEASEEKMG